MKKEQLKNILIPPVIITVIIWLVYAIEIYFDLNFNKLGIYPRTFVGLKGVFLSSFIHSDVTHLMNNTLPLFILTVALYAFYRKVANKTLLYGMILSGLFTWTVGRSSYHTGASDIIYLLFAFLFFGGIFKKYYKLMAVSLTVIFIYGGLVWFVLPLKNEVSWEGHLGGFLSGILLAYVYRNKGVIKPKFEFEETEFDKLFDEEGNLLERLEDETISFDE